MGSEADTPRECTDLQRQATGPGGRRAGWTVAGKPDHRSSAGETVGNCLWQRTGMDGRRPGRRDAGERAGSRLDSLDIRGLCSHNYD